MMREWRPHWILPLLFAAVVMGGPLTAWAHSLDAVERQLRERESYIQIVNREVPTFQLLDVHGRQVRLDEFRDKVVILNFIFASCTDLCPLHTQKLIDLQQMINGTPMRDLVQFISITTDPAQDTPEVLQRYVVEQGVDPVNWIFLSSGIRDPTGTRELAMKFGLKFTPTNDGQQVHGAVTHLIDKEGRMRARYHGLKFKNVSFIQYASALANDFDKHKPGSDLTSITTREVWTEGLTAGSAAGSQWTFAVGTLVFLVIAVLVGVFVWYGISRIQRSSS